MEWIKSERTPIAHICMSCSYPIYTFNRLNLFIGRHFTSGPKYTSGCIFLEQMCFEWALHVRGCKQNFNYWFTCSLVNSFNSLHPRLNKGLVHNSSIMWKTCIASEAGLVSRALISFVLNFHAPVWFNLLLKTPSYMVPYNMCTMSYGMSK